MSNLDKIKKLEGNAELIQHFTDFYTSMRMNFNSTKYPPIYFGNMEFLYEYFLHKAGSNWYQFKMTDVAPVLKCSWQHLRKSLQSMEKFGYIIKQSRRKSGTSIYICRSISEVTKIQEIAIQEYKKEVEEIDKINV